MITLSVRVMTWLRAKSASKPNRPISVSKVSLISAENSRRPFLRPVAVIALTLPVRPALLVERQARAQIDRAGDAALDHVGGQVLVGIDARQQFRRDVVEVEAARGSRRRSCRGR